MYKFTSLYNQLSKVSLAAGFCFAGFPKSYQKLHSIFLLHCILSTIPVIYLMLCNSVFYYISGLSDMKRHGITIQSIVDVFVTFYYLLCREEYKSFLCNFDKVTDEIIGSNFLNKRDVNYILNTARKFNSLIKYYFIVSSFIMMCFTTFPYVLRYVFARHFLFIAVPYSVHSEIVFHITALLQTASILFTLLKTVCSWSVMFLLLYHITLYLKTLRKSFEENDLFDKRDDRSKIKAISKINDICRLRSWIELHQKILRLISQFNKIYSPLLLVHLINFYASGLCYVFAITMQKEGLISSLLILSFLAVQMVAFLALFTIGNDLTHQSGKIFQNGYISIHLSADKAISSCGLIIGEVANRPVIVSVFGSEYFNLTLDTFIWMMKSMASFYIGLTQIEKLNETYVKS